MIGSEKDGSCWKQAFELLKEIVLEERTVDPDFALELEMMDDVTDYAYDIQGWLDDCLDEMDMREEYETLLSMCNDLIALFSQSEYTGSDIRFRKATVLLSLGKIQESVDFCEEWMRKEPENIMAATAGVYALTQKKEYDAAEKLVGKFILNRSECCDENEVMFVAASKLYEKMNKTKERKQLEKALQEYDDYVGQCFLNGDLDEDGLLFEDDELPFL